MPQRGFIDLDQIQGGLLSGTTGNTQIVTVLLGSIIAGTVPVWGTDGNLTRVSSPIGGVNVVTTDQIIAADQAGRLLIANSSTPLLFTLPAALPTDQWISAVWNLGSGDLSVAPPAGGQINGSSDPLTFSQGQGALIFTDGSGHFFAFTSGGSASITTHSELLVDNDGNPILANGDVIYVMGVPN